MYCLIVLKTGGVIGDHLKCTIMLYFLSVLVWGRNKYSLDVLINRKYSVFGSDQGTLLSLLFFTCRLNVRHSKNHLSAPDVFAMPLWPLGCLDQTKKTDSRFKIIVNTILNFEIRKWWWCKLLDWTASFKQAFYFGTLIMLYPSVLFWLLKPGNITECTLDSPELQIMIFLCNHFLVFKLQYQLLRNSQIISVLCCSKCLSVFQAAETAAVIPELIILFCYTSSWKTSS